MAILVAAGALALAGPYSASGGVTTPNDGDVVLGTSGGFRYAAEGRLADSGAAIAGCGPTARRLIGGGGAISGPVAEG